MGLFFLTNQAMSTPEDLLNLSLNAKAILPEGFVLLALIGTPIVYILDLVLILRNSIKGLHLMNKL